MIETEAMPFSSEVHEFVRSSFAYLDKDMFGNERLFFENSGGSLRLKSVVAEEAKFAAYPDCPLRDNPAAQLLTDTMERGMDDIRLFLNAKDGSIIPSSTASKIMFEIIGVIAEHSVGTNIVTTGIEHPSSYDACKMYADKTQKELRVAQANQHTGGVDVEDIISLVDSETSLLSVMMTSNISGTVLDIETIVKKVREINPDIFIVVDAVQAAPHSVIDVDKLQIDGLNIAPYKMFGNRGMAYGYVSDRVAAFPHHRLLATDETNWSVGSPAPAHFAGFTKIVDYLCQVGSFYTDTTDRRTLLTKGMTKIHQHEQALLDRIIHGSDEVQGIQDIEGVNIHFIDHGIENKDLIAALTFNQLSCSEAVGKYGVENILVYERVNSNHYSKRILDSLQVEGIVRVSPLHCHSFEDIDKFLLATKKIASL
ncbi:aminotransferase class V-fold PLP-dependent enzyme [Ornithinibacillus halophilus]|uniref:Selenocysteine lyase/Cysteine desulfurase n=1 Tax=Ornithinibacillus halophilus TaxID=930117 RepID=A0A1M5GM92_9BACI|nr:aminotransferase class V-fold PLP-dependent enzyme [Ornithinibacillus halophilus]SHG04859.1 Selenocysteine lyase/Cysteine desulfurase [Ornithinibacillus halophilus]